MLDFSNTNAIESAVFVKWDIPNFPTAYLSDYNQDITFGGNTYINLGTLLNITGYISELRASPSELSIALSGIATGSVSQLLNQAIKGSVVEIYRGFFDPQTHQLLSASGDNPVLKFKGIVVNYELADDVDISTVTATTTITLACSSQVEILNSKLSGRRTNPVDFPGEDSMKKVPALANSNFNFGAPGSPTSPSTNVRIVGINR